MWQCDKIRLVLFQQRKMRKTRRCYFILTIIILLPTAFIIKKVNEKVCIESVQEVNDILLYKSGFSNRTCKKLHVKTATECNQYDEKMFKEHSDSHLELELDNCFSYINNTKVKFNTEEKKTPLAFSILTHTDAVQLSRLIK